MKLKKLYTLLLSGIVAAGSAYAEMPEKTPAFPGAEGFGRYTTGGRGGNVYYVTHLRDDNTTGSLRWALSQPGPRTIVFSVSGTIHLTNSLNIPDNTTIAGQTAPGDGICVADYPFNIEGNNVIVRYMRIRLGNNNVLVKGADGWDGFGAMDCQDIIIDHCSVSWSIDECLSVLGNKNTTVQWCISAQSLVNSGHTKGAHGYGGNWGGAGASFHHNLIIHHTSRTPRLGPRQTTQLDERMDMRNNVIYNFGGNGCYGGEAMKVNIVNNYYKPGPGSPTDVKGKRIAGVGIRTNAYCNTYPAYTPALHIWGKYFVEGNVNTKYPEVTADNWTNGMYNQIDTSRSATDGTWSQETKDSIRIESPIPFIYTTTHSAEDAYARVMDYVGCSLVRDSFDDQMIYDCENGVATSTGSGLSKGFINSQNDNKPADADESWSAWPTLNSAAAPVDTDKDGMPDEWELANGLDPNSAADGKLYREDGYTNVEHYLNSLVAHITEAQSADGVVEGDVSRIEFRDEYLLAMSTKEANGWSFGDGIRVSNTNNGSYNTRGDFWGFGRDMQHTITLPAGIYVNKVKFEGFCRYAGSNYSDASLVELAGTDYAEGEHAFTKSAKEATPEAFTVELPEPYPAGTLTMTWKGNNPFLRMTLYATDKATGAVEEITVNPADDPNAPAVFYNLQGIRVDNPAKGQLYIRHQGGKASKVIF